jgi:diaminopimelate epimerase
VGSPALAAEPFEVAGQLVYPVRVGNPHGVVFVDDPDRVDVAAVGARIEHDTRFPDRANAEFVAVAGSDRVRMRIWERGVGETMASGTGATAAAFAAVHHRGVGAPVQVELPGGLLTIELVDGRAWMIGPANVVYEGRLPEG